MIIKELKNNSILLDQSVTKSKSKVNDSKNSVNFNKSKIKYSNL